MTEQVRGAGQPSWPLSPYQIAVSYGAGPLSGPHPQAAVPLPNPPPQAGEGRVGAGIARGTGADWFGPLDPLRPIAPPDVAGRRFDFPPGYNLVTRPRAYEPIGFAELRAFADAYDLLRLVIETRKDQMERQRWRIRSRLPLSALAKRGRGDGRPSAAVLEKNADAQHRLWQRSSVVEGALDPAQDNDTAARIAAIEDFFLRPDGVTRWKTWLRALLEDMFVIDAATLYCQRTRSGQLCALAQLDGATIKRVIDDWGRTPLPYYDPFLSSPAGGGGKGGGWVYPPAYQQVLKGLPAVNYSARDIIYRPRNVRAQPPP